MKKTIQPTPDRDGVFSFDDLPNGWELKKLGEIVSPSKEKIEPTADSTLPYIGLEHIESNTSKIIGQAIASDAKSTKTVFHSGDVLYGKLRPYLNKVAIPDFDGVCSTDILVFNQNQIIDSRYLMRYLSTREVVEYANLKSKGLSLPRVSFESLSEILIPFPPLDEQQRIVARVEALLSHVNAARLPLSRVPLIMKQFRQAVLAAACSGRLTEGWREENVSRISSEVFLKQALDFRRKYYTKKSNKKYKEPVILSDEFSFSLPDEWTWATLDQISQFVTDGDHYPPKRVPTGIPHLTSKHVKKWQLSYEDCSFISHEDYEIVKVRYEPQKGDVILTCVGTIGETAIVPEKFVFSADRNLAAIRLFPEFFLPQMLQFILNSAPWENHIKTVSGSTAQPHIYLKDLRAMAVPLPPLAEQYEIVRHVGLLFERADAFDQEVVAASRRCERLTQAVLGKAFRGELVGSKYE